MHAGYLPPGSPYVSAEGTLHNITWNPCHYGGSRPWFVCPLCQRSIATLYAAGGDAWACRKCLGLAYTSQCESETGRALRRLTKAQNKLAQHGSRPKGMHRRTYLRLLEHKAQAERILLGRLM